MLIFKMQLFQTCEAELVTVAVHSPLQKKLGFYEVKIQCDMPCQTNFPVSVLIIEIDVVCAVP